MTPFKNRPSLRASVTALAVLIVGASACVPEEPVPNPPVSPAIAFVSERSGNDELYLVDTDGTNLIRLTNSPGFDRAPSWSNDGTQLVFNSRRDPHGTQPEIYIMKVDDQSLRRVTNDELEDQRASFTPGDESVISQRGNFANGWRIIETDLDTGATSTIVNSPGFWAAAPAVSPDGTRLVFQSNHESTGIFPFRLYVMDLESGAITDLGHADSGSDDGPRWSPDGTTIAFSSSRDGGDSHLHLVDIATGEVTQLTFGASSDSSPSWSPDGTQIVFQSDRTYEDGGVHIIDLDSGTITDVAEGRTPVWSPADR